ncbi:MAG: SPFH domain-containing protein [Anaerolineae bacterium]|nr:SPFH domain-containing protein [Anaerolineae bacterium]MCO5189610.1 SPFH domain-containing protein [Anaerolineae bacterium]MCO5196481.1 SPFH domain-containing protein [Anaerolineae bacterium]MCO5207240.1 SPFH domain-containing protein [Anaerolineae bacterium]
MKSSVDKSEDKTPNPFSHYLHTIIRRRTYVPENHVRVIMQDNMFYDILPAGYYRIHRWKYTLGPEISIGLRSASLDDVSCYSRDGVHVKLKGRVLFRFDPNLCDRTILHEIVKLPESVLGGLGKRSAARELRHVVGEYYEIELRSGATRAEIQKTATERMKKASEFLGVTVVGRINVEEIIFPPTVERMHHIAFAAQLTAPNSQDYRREIVRLLLEVERLRQFQGNLRIDERERQI